MNGNGPELTRVGAVLQTHDAPMHVRCICSRGNARRYDPRLSQDVSASALTTTDAMINLMLLPPGYRGPGTRLQPCPKPA